MNKGECVMTPNSYRRTAIFGLREIEAFLTPPEQKGGGAYEGTKIIFPFIKTDKSSHSTRIDRL